MTIREIAALAGISPAAVSLVINGKKGVSEETRKRVTEIIEENGYHIPDKKKHIERFRLMLIKYRAHGIALEENQGFIASIIDRIEYECRRHDFDLMMCNCEAKNAVETIRDLMAKEPHGVILIGTELRPSDYSLLNLFTVPTVLLDNLIAHPGVDCVVMDNRSLTRQAVRYLYNLGHRDIGYFRFSQPVNNCDDRYAGFLEEMAELGLEPRKTVCLNPTLDGAYTDMFELIRSGGYVPSGAVVADNDTVAIGAMKAITESGYRIPEDLSIIGFDDIPFSGVTSPGLTTIRISRSTMGTLAVDMLRRRVKHPEWPEIRIQIGGKLVERGSAGKIAAP